VGSRRLLWRYVVIDLNPGYCEMARKRIGEVSECLPFEAPDVDESSGGIKESEQGEFKI